MPVKVYDGTNWVTVAGDGAAGAPGTSSSIVTWVKTASGGETSVSGTGDSGYGTLSYTVGQELVYLNGVLLDRGDDYTATNGTSITGLTALLANDVITVWTVNAFSVANTYTQAQIDASFASNSNSFFAGKNAVINGDFGIWQRGTSITQTNGAYNADRFLMVFDGSGATRTVSQQTFTPGAAPGAGYEGTYFWRLNQSVAGTSGTYNVLQQKIEDVRTFAGQTVTFSFWAKADASRTVRLDAYQYFGTGGSSPVQTVAGQLFSATTSWQRFTYTTTLPSISGKTIGTSSFFSYEIGMPTNTTFTIDIWGVQLEAGSVATAFTTASGGSPQAELAACQRYYYRLTAPTNYASMGIGIANTTSVAIMQVPFPVNMRVAPTSVDYSTVRLTNTNTGWAATALVLSTDINSQFIGGTQTTIGSASLSAGTTYFQQANNSTSAYLGFNAEL